MAYNTAEPRAEYSATAGQTEFDFVFKIFSISDLKVYSTPFGQTANDETDILIENIDYTVSINGDNGGTVTLTNPAGIDDVIVLLRDLPVKRDYEYQQGGDLSSDTLNDDQDYQTYLLADKQKDSDRFLKLPDTAIVASNVLPPILPNAYLKWNEDGTELQYDTSIPAAAILSTDAALIAESYATEPEDVFVKTYNNGVPTNTTDYSALHWAAKSEVSAGDSDDSAVESQLSQWLSDAAKLTAQSYATEPEDVFVKTYSSDGNGTFTATPTTDYSSLHWAAKSEESAQGLAENISFDNSGTGIVATDVQEALVEIDNEARTHIPLSGVTAYHLLQGNLSVSDEVITKGFGIYTYTGNSTVPPTINLGMDITSQWGNDASETFGYLIKFKSRSVSGDWTYVDSIRGITKYISSNTTAVEGTDANMFTLNTVGGITTLTLGSSTRTNVTGTTYVVEIYQTTHRISGTTNHNKPYTCHFNPAMGFSIDKMEGSGIAGHEIPHHLGRELSINMIKNLTAVTNWRVQKSDNITALLNTADAWTGSGYVSSNNTSNIVLTSATDVNASTQLHIMYGWANSYFDKANKLIGNYEIGMYQGTGASGNKVQTRGKPAWVMLKRIDSGSDWHIFDNQRDDIVSSVNDGVLWANTSGAEATTTNFISLTPNDGFIINDTTANTNASGGQYLYIVAYDTNSNGGGSYYPLASDTANVQVNNALIPIAQGIDANGVKNSIVVANETITGVTYTAGKNYLYKTDSGYGVKPYEPRYLFSELVRRFAGEQPDYYDVESNKWFNCDAGTELVTNGKFDVNTTGWTGYSYNGSVFVSDATVLTAISGLGTVTVASGKTYPAMEQALTTVVGKKYKLKFNRAITTGTFTACIATLSILGTNAMNSGALFYFDSATTGDYEFEFVATQTTYYLRGGCSSVTVGQYSKFDGFTSFPVEITPTTEIIESRNYMNHIVHADNDGGILYVEELPKIEYKDIVKANEFKGKNACTAWVNFDGTTTPPTIRDSFNVSSVVRTATGVYDVYFEKDMDNVSYVMSGSGTSNTYSTIADPSVRIPMSTSNGQQLTKCTIMTKFVSNSGTGSENWNEVKLYFQGGKN